MAPGSTRTGLIALSTAASGMSAAIYETSKLSPSALRRRGEIDEEIVGGLLRRTVDQALAKLGELAADLRLHVIGEKRAAVLVGEPHVSRALGEARDAASPSPTIL